jgi:hypothetical protein
MKASPFHVVDPSFRFSRFPNACRGGAKNYMVHDTTQAFQLDAYSPYDAKCAELMH